MPMIRCLSRYPGTLCALAVLPVLGACATARPVGNADDMQDDGKRNTVMFSYQVQADAFDRYRGENGTTLQLRCGGDSLTGSRTCFSLPLPFVGQQLDDGVAVNRFELAEAQPFLMKYGDYRIDHADFKVVIGRIPQVDCVTDKKGRTRCDTTFQDVHEDHAFALPVPIDFLVTPGSGCYLGHLTLAVRGDQVLDYRLDTAIDEAAFERLPVELRQRARELVDRPCG